MAVVKNYECVYIYTVYVYNIYIYVYLFTTIEYSIGAPTIQFGS